MSKDSREIILSAAKLLTIRRSSIAPAMIAELESTLQQAVALSEEHASLKSLLKDKRYALIACSRDLAKLTRRAKKALSLARKEAEKLIATEAKTKRAQRAKTAKPLAPKSVTRASPKPRAPAKPAGADNSGEKATDVRP